MASRVKEDEKNERIIRGLLKLPANRRCINCNSLGPQYVCTNFWTFICINCSGIHREFTHRVKSISMAKFSPQEVSSLQEGGNERAKEIYFKEWDPHRHSFPDSSNIDRLREFIKHVYVDRRFTGGRSSDEPPKNLHRLREFIKHVYVDRRFTGGRSSDEPPKRETVDSYGKNKVDTYQGSRSPQYDNTDIRRYSERLGSVSPPSDYKTSPGQFDRDDRSGYQSQDRSTVDQQFPDSSKRELMSPNQHNKVDGSKSPKSQPVSVVSIPPASIGEPAKPSGLQLPRSSAHAQNTASSSSRGSNTGNPVELKVVSSRSLIDFDADPVPPTTRAMDHSVPQLTTGLNTESGGWASFDDSSSLKVKQVIEADTLLSQLSVTQIASAAKDPSISIAGIGSFSNQSNTGQWTTIQQHQPPLSQASIQSNNQPFNTSFIGAPDNRVAPTSLTVQSSQALFVPLHEANNAISPQFTSTEPKPSGRKELPADLFTMTYPSTFTQFPYYRPPQHPMGYGMQYPTVFAMPSYPHPSTLPNPFAPTDESKLVHASTFPNLAHLQSALPNVAGHSSILRISSMPSQQWLPQQVPISTTPQSPFPMQQGGGPMPQPPPNTMYHVMRQTIGGFNTEGAAFNFSGIDQNLDSRNYRPHSPNTSTPGRNPFG